ncbi:MAG: hypothetical protein KatS3mg051_2198 [Anaerolineae bacterium]|nr:MAG: hypothetical protein KatS3mg051_2198 [Anaerolineae bacterium]
MDQHNPNEAGARVYTLTELLSDAHTTRKPSSERSNCSTSREETAPQTTAQQVYSPARRGEGEIVIVEDAAGYQVLHVYHHGPDHPTRRRATPKEIVKHLTEACALIGLRQDPERITAIARRVAEWGWTVEEVRLACQALSDDPERCEPIRRFGAISPADVRAARPKLPPPYYVWHRDKPRPCHVEGPVVRPDAARKRHMQRLQTGTILPPPGTPEYDRAWQTWYDDEYIRDARQKARQYLQGD